MPKRIQICSELSPAELPLVSFGREITIQRSNNVVVHCDIERTEV